MRSNNGGAFFSTRATQTPTNEIDREEFIRIMKTSVTAPENFEEVVIRIADSFVHIVDTTGDGPLNFNEYVQMYDGLGVDPKYSTERGRECVGKLPTGADRRIQALAHARFPVPRAHIPPI